MPSRKGRDYNPNDAARLRAIQLPAKIRCGSCRKTLNQAMFSDVKLDKLRQAVSDGEDGVTVDCRTCIGSPLVEITCSFCGVAKGLEEFAKVQRRNRTNPRCFACTEAQVSHQPVDEARYEAGQVLVTPDDSAGTVPDYHQPALTGPSSQYDWSSVSGDSDATYCGGIPLSDRLNGMSLVSSSNENALIELGSTDGRNSHAETWRTGPSGNIATGKHTSQSGSAHTYASSIAEVSESSSQYGNAAQPKKSAPAVMLPMGDLRGQVESETNPWDSDDEDEDEDDDDSDGENTII